MLNYIVYFIGAYIITRFSIKKILFLLETGDATRENYRKEKIPVSSGIFFVPLIIVNSIFIILLEKNIEIIPLSIFLIGTITMAFLGLCDDLLGNRNITGLKGHLLYILKGKLSTGGLKAVIGGAVAFTISLLMSKEYVDVVVNTLVIALFTNFINLLDLRPGRAIKGFLVCSLIVFVYPINYMVKNYIYTLYGGILAYVKYDLKAKSMLGDVGSNLMGVSLGILWVYNTGIEIRSIVLVFLILIHLYAEKYSITKTIEKVSLLKYIDDLGR
ncbi:MAG: glycosyl transferase [Anaeromicrobium sp.]|jgi:hypothetical protein|uniref:glycosyl transferase n=1 Tax=Anaeromicrobium sp. TaxID=1929132 RepID=UPI0026009D5B|nr:glycosyl transferase [Anaeromicrobium sp.]MCT4594681.1 glycosyl transferase [Anaeromicrobium sp.]